MTTAIAIRSILELAGILLLLYGIYKEEKLIDFEQKAYRILYVNYRRYVRKKKGIPLQHRKEAAKASLTLYEQHTPDGHGGMGFVA